VRFFLPVSSNNLQNKELPETVQSHETRRSSMKAAFSGPCGPKRAIKVQLIIPDVTILAEDHALHSLPQFMQNRADKSFLR
jgi:hypothetical protein